MFEKGFRPVEMRIKLLLGLELRGVHTAAAAAQFYRMLQVKHLMVDNIFDRVARDSRVIENAAHYSPAGSTITITAALLPDGLAFSVGDEGPGIPAEDLPKIFNRFYRGGEGHRHASGTGMGLTIAQGLLATMGGRIVPSFTRNWLASENPGRLPVPFAAFDRATLVFCAMALLVWVAMPLSAATAFMLIAAGMLQVLRLGRWAGDRTWRNRLVLVLHVGYAFVPIGFVLTGLAAIGLMLPSAGIHAWTVGAVGTMTLAVMTRASLGHTGNALVASVGTQAMYAAVALEFHIIEHLVAQEFDVTIEVPVVNGVD